MCIFCSDAFHKQPLEVDLVLACVGEANTTVRGGIRWPIICGVGMSPVYIVSVLFTFLLYCFFFHSFLKVIYAVEIGGIKR